MATRADIEDVLWEAFLAATELEALWTNQPDNALESAPAPDAESWATLQIISGLTRIGLTDESRPPRLDASSPSKTDSTLRKRTGPRLLTLSAVVHGEGCRDLVQAWANYFQRDKIRGALRRNQTDKATVTDAQNSTEYVLAISGAEVKITSGIGATPDSVRDALKAEMEELFPEIVATDGATGELLLEADASKPFSLSVGDRLAASDHVAAVLITLLRTGGETVLDQVLDAAWEARANIDLFMTTPSWFEEDLGAIETVIITDEGSGTTFTVEA